MLISFIEFKTFTNTPSDWRTHYVITHPVNKEIKRYHIAGLY